MSHFACSVFHRVDENPEELLAPYSWESIEYFEREIYMTKEEYITNYKSWHENTTLTDEAIWEKRHEEYDDTDDDFIYTSHNPNGHFDWWTAGGRYSDSLKVRKSAVTPQFVATINNYDGNNVHMDNALYAPPYRFCNDWDQRKNRYYTVYSAPIKDVLWGKMSHNKTNYNKLIKDWETNERLHDNYRNKDEYLAVNTMFYTWAYYDNDNGDWGSLEEFGSFKEYIEHYIDMIDRYSCINDMWITIVDCHT